MKLDISMTQRCLNMTHPESHFGMSLFYWLVVHSPRKFYPLPRKSCGVILTRRSVGKGAGGWGWDRTDLEH